MKFLLHFLFTFYINFIYGQKTYPPKIYDSFKTIAQKSYLNDKNYFENCTFIASELTGNITKFNASGEIGDETLVPIMFKLKNKLLKTDDKKVAKLSPREKRYLDLFENVTLKYLLVAGDPSKTNQYHMNISCERNSNELKTLIVQFNASMDLVSRKFLRRYSYTDAAFQELKEIFQKVADQVAMTHPVCARFLGKSYDSIMKDLEDMTQMISDKFYDIEEERRENFWNFDLISKIIQKFIGEATDDDQNLANKIQNFLETNYNKTDYIFSVLIFYYNSPFTASTNNVYVYENETDSKSIIVTRSNERCTAYDTIESNVQEACIDGGKNKVENIKKFLTQKCQNSTIIVNRNFVYSTNKKLANIKMAKLSQYGWIFFEQCLKEKVLIAVINN
jgi:hypothetical protein